MRQLKRPYISLKWRIKHAQFERWERRNFKIGTRVIVGSAYGTIVQFRPMMVKFDDGKTFHVMPGVDAIRPVK